MPKSYRCGCAPASCARLTCCARRPIRLFLGVALLRHGLAGRGWIATYRSQDTSLADFTRCLNLNPSDPDKSNTLLGVSTAHFLAGRYDEAAEWAVRGVRE